MKLAIALAILVGGIVLMIYGVNASHSFSSDVSRIFTGNPTDRSMWFLISGAVLIVAGGSGLVVSGKQLRTS